MVAAPIRAASVSELLKMWGSGNEAGAFGAGTGRRPVLLIVAL
jgi:hypothetical protein